MPGVPKRDRKGSAEPKNKAEIKPSDVAAKIGKEAITAQEMAVYLEAQKPDITMSDKTVKNHIKDICEKSEGMLNEEDFKSGRKFLFEPHYQGLLLSLLDTSVFDDRQNDRKLATKSKLNTELAENVDKYLTGEDSELVKESPIYITVRLEDELFKRINQEISAIVRDSYHTDAAVRWKSLQEYLDALKKVRLAVQHRYSDSFAKRMVYAHEFDDREDAFYQRGLFKAETMEDLLIAMLACRIHGKNKNIGLSPMAMC